MPFRAFAVVGLAVALVLGAAPAAEAAVPAAAAARAVSPGAVVPASASSSAPDLSVASSVVGVVRTSAASVSSGGTVSFLWKVRDVGATTVVVGLVDRLGGAHEARWDGAGSLSGVASVVVDSAKWPAGAYPVAYVRVFGPNGTVLYYPDGTYSQNPTGLKVVPPTNLKFPALGFTVG